MTEEYREHPDPTGEDPAGGDDVEQLDDEELQALGDDEGPDVSELDDEPDYNPEGGLGDLKGG